MLMIFFIALLLPIKSRYLKILIIDNFDSFTFNLKHYCEEIIEEDVVVKRTNEIAIEDLDIFDKIIISPGPGLPSETPLLNEVIATFKNSIPILGVCLGMQAIAEHLNIPLVNLDRVHHGVKHNCDVDPNAVIFNGLPGRIQVGHYHSWCISEPNDELLKVIARGPENRPMAIVHEEFLLTGIQFHPESVLTPEGKTILRNWLLHQ